MMEAVDTKDLQWASVVAVMKQLGYRYSQAHNGFRANFKNLGSGTDKISVCSAITIHNAAWLNGDYVYTFPNTNPRLVKRVKLQWHKRSKTLICQSHMVKFCDGVNPEDYL